MERPQSLKKEIHWSD